MDTRKKGVKTMKWFENCSCEGEIKSRYRDLARKHHPDLGGDTATMQAINAAYESALKSDYRQQGFNDEKINWRWDMDAEIMEKAAELLKISKELRIEICGLWVWITGETKAVKEVLKSAGCRFAPKKSAWYWRRERDGYRRRRHKPLDMQSIRRKYGTYAMRDTDNSQVAAFA